MIDMLKASALLLLTAAGALAGPASLYREVTFRVVDEGGTSVSDVEVQLHGLDRDALGIGSEEKESGKYRGWQFKTNSAGLFTARFGKFRQYDHEEATGLIEPGYGQFYCVAEGNGTAGGVSCEVLNLNDEDLQRRKTEPGENGCSRQEGEEWQRGAFAPCILADEKPDHPLEIVLKRGVSVIGQMIYTNGSPVRDEDVSVFLDLHAGSHTGHGGEIFRQQTTTDRHGTFRFRSVYPNSFYIALLHENSGPVYWTRTRVRNRWVDKIEDEITPHQDEWDPDKSEKSIPVLIVAEREAPYRYFGQVTDLQGRGVAGAEVEIRCSLHEPERTFEDDHSYWWNTKTDEHGNYSLRVGTRFVNAIWVKKGENTGNDDSAEGDLMAPGRYDITLRPNHAKR